MAIGVVLLYVVH